MKKEDYREVLGARLKEFRESRGLSMYAVAKKGNIRIDQVGIVESGDTNYTIDVFTGYIIGCDLYMYFAEKDGNLKFDELIEKGKDNDPSTLLKE